MKLVTTYSSVDEAEEASRFLEENGIAAFVSSKRSLSLGRVFAGAFEVGLWAVLDEQAPDAAQLLRDPNHKVARKLSRTEIIEIRKSVRSGDMSIVLKVLFQLLLIVSIFVFIVLAITRS